MTPTLEEYIAAGRDPETAEERVGLDALCEARTAALRKLDAVARVRHAKEWADHNRRVENDPECRAEREASRKAYEAWTAALDAGQSIKIARACAMKACGRRELRFDYSKRERELRRRSFGQHATASRIVVTEAGKVTDRIGQRARGAGRPAVRGESRRSSAKSGDGGADPDEPWRRRFAALTFERFARLTAPLPPHWRAAIHARLPAPIQAQAWQTLREQTERERDNPPADIVARRRAHSEYRRAA